MAPIKFEENIKDKLDKRTLQPSADAWSKLSEQLDAHESKGNNKTIWWIGLAASVVGVLLVVSQFFNNETQEVVPQVVDSPKIETTIEPKQDIKVAKENVIEAPIVKDVKTISKKEINKPEKTAVVANNTTDNSEIVVKENKAPDYKPEPKVTVAIVPKELTFEEETIQNVVAKIHKLQDKSEITDEAIDALLLQAQKEITLNKLYNENTKVVDADLLLQDVEADLDRSFRTKVFETLKASYNSVKTAVAQRND